MRFEFHPELFAHKVVALDALANAGIQWLVDYSSIDLDHEHIGLEITGIREHGNCERILDILRTTFPSWHRSRQWEADYRIEPGWVVGLSAY